jgi:hypothetical protein
MKELILGLFGGGVVVQLLNTLIHRTANQRQLNANALGTEVSALERTIVLLRENLEAEIQRHDRERQLLTERIDALTAQTLSLTADIAQLREENATLRKQLQAHTD